MIDLKDLNPDVVQAAREVTLLLLDCDGVLTDGRLYFNSEGEAMKAFHVHDGQGISNWHAAGYKTGIITGRKSSIAKARADELAIEFVLDNVKDKSSALDRAVEMSGVETNLIVYVGDDVADLPAMRRVRLPIAVNNCTKDLLSEATLVTSKNGGSGAVREVVDLLLAVKSS